MGGCCVSREQDKAFPEDPDPFLQNGVNSADSKEKQSGADALIDLDGESDQKAREAKEGKEKEQAQNDSQKAQEQQLARLQLELEAKLKVEAEIAEQKAQLQAELLEKQKLEEEARTKEAQQKAAEEEARLQAELAAKQLAEDQAKKDEEAARLRLEAAQDNEKQGEEVSGSPKNEEVCCPSGHPLEAFRTPGDGYWCDKCHGKVASGTMVYRCSDCLYDVCSDCATNWKAHSENSNVNPFMMSPSSTIMSPSSTVNAAAPGNVRLSVGSTAPLPTGTTDVPSDSKPETNGLAGGHVGGLAGLVLHAERNQDGNDAVPDQDKTQALNSVQAAQEETSAPTKRALDSSLASSAPVSPSKEPSQGSKPKKRYIFKELLQMEVLRRYEKDELSLYSADYNQTFTANNGMPSAARLAMSSTKELHERWSSRQQDVRAQTEAQSAPASFAIPSGK